MIENLAAVIAVLLQVRPDSGWLMVRAYAATYTT
jgi:hypothetical protein